MKMSKAPTLRWTVMNNPTRNRGPRRTNRFRFVLLIVIAVLAVAGCTGGDSSSDGSADEALAFDGELTSSDAQVADRAAGEEDTQSDPVTEDDIAVLLASGERMLAGGPYEGVMYQAPELYVASAQVVCSRLAEGKPLPEVISEFMSENSLDAADQADFTLAGTVVGAGVQTLCPQHRDLI